MAWEVEVCASFSQDTGGALCGRPEHTGLLSLGVLPGPGNMQALALASLLAALSRVSSPSFLLPFGSLQQLLLLQVNKRKEEDGGRGG